MRGKNQRCRPRPKNKLEAAEIATLFRHRFPKQARATLGNRQTPFPWGVIAPFTSGFNGSVPNICPMIVASRVDLKSRPRLEMRSNECRLSRNTIDSSGNAMTMLDRPSSVRPIPASIECRDRVKCEPLRSNDSVVSSARLASSIWRSCWISSYEISSIPSGSLCTDVVPAAGDCASTGTTRFQQGHQAGSGRELPLLSWPGCQ